MRTRIATAATMTVLAAGVVAVSGAGHVAAATASGSIAFVRAGNVWLVRADGTGLHQVTRDGTDTHPYRSPSLSDAGIVAAGFGNEIVRMQQNGVVINRIDPPPMLNSVSQPVDGPPVSVAISPDGTKIAYTMTSYTCPVGVSCGARSVTGVTAADRFTGPTMTSFERQPSWVTNSRLMVHGGYGSQVKLQDAVGGSQHWFDDSDLVGDLNSTDLGDASLSRDGSRLVLIRGYGAETQMRWYAVSGDPRTASAASLPDPVSQCAGAPGATPADPALHDPTWSPDGSAFAIGATDGIWVVALGRACEATTFTLLGPGAEPSWSPAAIAPPPVPTAGTPPVVSSFQMTARPRLKGVAKVGKRLVATPGRWSPSPEKVRYTWLRNGKLIKAATKKAYRVTRRDRGKRLSVKVTVSRSGYQTSAATSRPKRVR